MAEGYETTETERATVLVAHVRVHLESGESFELLPFEDAEDVKSKVCELMKAWAKSGFLIRGSEIYPWHRVRRIEAIKVEEVSIDAAELRGEEQQAQETARLQRSFWKTRRARKEKDDENGQNDKGQGEHEGMAA